MSAEIFWVVINGGSIAITQMLDAFVATER